MRKCNVGGGGVVQDRCHRIGQTRDVHIYRLISEHTVEENILRKSNQKRHLDQLAIQSAGFTTAALGGGAIDAVGTGGVGAIRDILGVDLVGPVEQPRGTVSDEEYRTALAQVEDADDAAAASVAEREVAEANAENADDFGEPGPGGAGGEGTVTVGASAPGEARPSGAEARAALRPIEQYAVRVRVAVALCAVLPSLIRAVQSAMRLARATHVTANADRGAGDRAGRH